MEEEVVWRFLLDDLALDVCFEMHQRAKIGGMSLDELYDVTPIERKPAEPPVIETQSLDVTCSHCRQEVHATRYARHFEKCVNGSRRQAGSGQRASKSATDRITK